MQFAEFKTKLCSYEDTEKMRCTTIDDYVMKARMQKTTMTFEEKKIC